MFKSIHYKISIYVVLIVMSTAGVTWLFFSKNYLYVIPAALVLIACLVAMNRQYRQFNRNIIFLLDALNNGDYSFHFSETRLSAREKELNRVMNRIKEMLAEAREEVIANEKFLSIIVETVPVGLIMMDKQGGITNVNRTVLQWFGLASLTHVNQLGRVNATYPGLFAGLRPGDSAQLTLVNEREELQISLRATEIVFKQGVMKLISLNNIGDELESREIESWIRLIRVMTHEIMNSIAPITSLSETMLSVLRSGNGNVKNNTVEAFETISETAKGLSIFVESYRKFTDIPQPVLKLFTVNELVTQAVHLHTLPAAEKNIRIRILSNAETNLYADKNLIMQVLVNLIPFFTTKEGGSGIGLSVSRYIMRLHGGNLLHSVSPKGTTVFSMVFL